MIGRWLLQARWRAKEMKCYVHDLIKDFDDSQNKIAIFAQGRTGSTLLEDLICSTGHFEGHGEVLGTGNREVLFPGSYVRGLSKSTESKFVFHFKIYQIQEERSTYSLHAGRFLKMLEDENFEIVYIRRKDKLRQVISGFVAEKRNNYHKLSDKKEKIELKCEAEKIVNKLEERIKTDEREEEALEGVDFRTVVYEEDLKDSSEHEETIRKVLSPFGFEVEGIETEHKKINKRPVREILSNYERVARLIESKGLEGYTSEVGRT